MELGRLILLLGDLNMVKEDLSVFNVSLFARNHELREIIMFLQTLISSSILPPCTKTFVSSAKILKLPRWQQLGRSFIKRIKKSGPRTDPWGTPQLIGLVTDLCLSIDVNCSRFPR